jgi:hypothetical protein
MGYVWCRNRSTRLQTIVYCLPTKKNKLPFTVPVYSKEKEVCRFHFPFAINKRKLPFSVSSIFRVCGGVGRYVCAIYSICCRFKQNNGKLKPRRCSIICLPFAHRSNRILTRVCPFVDKETNGSYLFADGLNRLAHLWVWIDRTY